MTELDQAKLTIYLLIGLVCKDHPEYLTSTSVKALEKHEPELRENINLLEEGVTLDDLVVSLFSKKEFH